MKLAEETGRELTRALRAAVQLGEARVIISILIMPDVLDDLLLDMDFLCSSGATLQCGGQALTLRPSARTRSVAPRETNPDLARTQPEQQENHDEAVARTPTEQQENYGNTDNTKLHKYRKKTIDKPLLGHVQRTASAQPHGYRPVTTGRVQAVGTRQLRSLTWNWEQPRPGPQRYPLLTLQPSKPFSPRGKESGYESGP